MELDIIDCETASLSGGIVELGWIRVNESLEILHAHCWRVNPEREIDPGAFAIHGISDSDVAYCPTIAHVVAEIGFPGPVLWVGHNSAFDCRMLDPHIKPSAQLCTLALARQFVKYKLDGVTPVTNHKLATLKDELGLPPQASHTALGDCHTTLDLLKYLIPLSGVTLQTLIERAQEPKLLSKMPWGKHKGKSMISVPKSYRDWLLEQGDLDKDMKFTLDKLKGL